MDKRAARRDRYQRLLRNCVAVAEPHVIIWGPGSHNPQGYQKRERVRQAIQSEFPNGTFDFPEDPVVRETTARVLDSENIVDHELLQAMDADVVIALDLSTGVGEEVARYSAYRVVAKKLFVVAPEEHKAGYQGIIRSEVVVHFVKSSQMLACHETTRLCIAHVHSWCVRKYAEQ